MAAKPPARIQVETFADYQVITQPNPLRIAVRRISEDHDDPVARAEKALAGLSDQFDDWMYHECERLTLAHGAVASGRFSAAEHEEFYRAAHDIKGDAVTFGYPAAAAAADSLCRIIERAPDFNRVPAALIGHHVRAIQAIVRENKRAGFATIAAELSVKLRELADEYLVSVSPDRPETLSPGIVPAG